MLSQEAGDTIPSPLQIANLLEMMSVFGWVIWTARYLGNNRVRIGIKKGIIDRYSR